MAYVVLDAFDGLLFVFLRDIEGVDAGVDVYDVIAVVCCLGHEKED